MTIEPTRTPMRTTKHGRPPHGDSDFSEGQAFESQIRAPAPASLHPSCRSWSTSPPTNQFSPRPTRYTSPTGKTITVRGEVGAHPRTGSCKRSTRQTGSPVHGGRFAVLAAACRLPTPPHLRHLLPLHRLRQ